MLHRGEPDGWRASPRPRRSVGGGHRPVRQSSLGRGAARVPGPRRHQTPEVPLRGEAGADGCRGAQGVAGGPGGREGSCRIPLAGHRQGIHQGRRVHRWVRAGRVLAACGAWPGSGASRATLRDADHVRNVHEPSNQLMGPGVTYVASPKRWAHLKVIPRRIFAPLCGRAPSPHGVQISPFGAALSAARSRAVPTAAGSCGSLAITSGSAVSGGAQRGHGNRRSAGLMDDPYNGAVAAGAAMGSKRHGVPCSRPPRRPAAALRPTPPHDADEH